GEELDLRHVLVGAEDLHLFAEDRALADRHIAHHGGDRAARAPSISLRDDAPGHLLLAPGSAVWLPSLLVRADAGACVAQKPAAPRPPGAPARQPTRDWLLTDRPRRLAREAGPAGPEDSAVGRRRDIVVHGELDQRNPRGPEVPLGELRHGEPLEQ